MSLDHFVFRTALCLGLAACTSPAATKMEAGSPAPPLPSATLPLAAGGSTIDPKMQAVADEELDRVLREWSAAAGAIIVLDPRTGEILANAGRSHGIAADVAVRNAYITGSTMKAVTLVAALEEGLISPSEPFDCERGKWTYQGKEIHDADPNGVLPVTEMLATSTNIGFAKVYDRLGGARLSRWLRAFHFGTAPAMVGANPGEVPARIEDKTFDGAAVAMGATVTASPLQVAAAYAALANGGVYVPPTLSHRAGSPPREPIMKAETARADVGMLEEAVNGERAHGKRARVSGVRVAGKTGTAVWTLPSGEDGYYASFVGFVPSRVVILVGVEQPRDGGTGAKVAAPVFARVAARVLGG